jgi:aminoglycoside phosphotransferase family enzyme/predicted kinase
MPPSANSKTTRGSSERAREINAAAARVLVRSLRDPRRYDPPVNGVELIETHISSVLLAGDFAYKIKKPLDLGFLDFRRLAQRRHACEEEVRLNRRLAPHVYLDVVPITGTPAAPRLGGQGTPFEFAVRMRRFAADATLDRVDARGQLSARQIEAVATTVARFHAGDCARAERNAAWGTPDAIRAPMEQNFVQLAALLEDAASRAQLEALRRWSYAEHTRLAPLMAQRRDDGWVRECHGDLHLGNIAWIDEAPLVFDCIEFSPALRWIDVQSDVAFCFMDLLHRGHADLAWLFLNVWLEHTGDYAGLALLRYYAVYRALVRAKVYALVASQSRGARNNGAAARALLDLADALTHPAPARLDITHGVSGCGKTTATRLRMQTPGAIRLRSDVERKRRAGLGALARPRDRVGQALYTPETTRTVYANLAGLAAGLLDAGWPVIVDATFLARWQRDLLRDVARQRHLAFRILDFDVPLDVLHRRVSARSSEGRDASDADLGVLQRQLAAQEALDDDEQAQSISVDSSLALEAKNLPEV